MVVPSNAGHIIPVADGAEAGLNYDPPAGMNRLETSIAAPLPRAVDFDKRDAELLITLIKKLGGIDNLYALNPEFLEVGKKNPPLASMN